MHSSYSIFSFIQTYNSSMNVDAAKYAQTFTRKKDTFTKLLSQHTFQWQPEEYVIDFGCGTGNATKEILLNLNPGICQIVGADRELGMLQYAQEQNGDEKITYKVADIEVINKLSLSLVLFQVVIIMN